MRKIAYLGIIPMLAFMVFACQKNDLSSPSLTADAKGGGGGTPPEAFILYIPTAGTGCVGTDYCFNARFTNRGGNEPGGHHSQILIQVKDADGNVIPAHSQTLSGTNVNFCISGLAAGNYTVQVRYEHVPAENAQTQSGTYSFPLTIGFSEDCGGVGGICGASGINFTRGTSLISTDAGFAPLSLTVRYTVENCGTVDRTSLKLQGGLVNKATLTNSAPASSPAVNSLGDATNINYSSKKTNGNTTLTWTFDLAAGKTQNFDVSYNVAYPVSCGSPITGAWSVKIGGTTIGDGADIMANGYMNRLYWDCSWD